MRPSRLGLMIHPETGHVWIVDRRPRTTELVRNVTADFVLMQAAEVLNAEDPEAEGMSREYTARSSDGSEIEAEITIRILRRTPAHVRSPD